MAGKSNRQNDVAKTLRAYIDTSILGGCFDPIFERDTKAFMKYVRNGKIVPVLSDMVAGEIARAPERVQRLLHEMIRGGAEVSVVTEQAVDLQEAHLRQGILGRRWEDDAMHVAWPPCLAWTRSPRGTSSIWWTRGESARSTA
jgi:hypothetical protein